jgi:glucosylceramidase
MKANGSMAAFVVGQTPPIEACLLGYCKQAASQADYRDEYAQYFVDFVHAYQSRGIPIYALGVQNEPHAPSNYPGGTWSDADQIDFIGRVKRALAAQKPALRQQVWAEFDVHAAAGAVQNDPQANAVDGLSYHCYYFVPKGRVAVYDGIDAFHRAAPAKSIHETECTQDSHQIWEKTIDILITHSRHWVSSIANWNVALEPDGGPQSVECGKVVAGTCVSAPTGSIMSAPVVISDTAGGTHVSYTREYYEMGHFSKFVQPGAVRIASTELDGIRNVAFENVDGTRVLVVHNTGDAATQLTANVDDDHHFDVHLPADGIATYVWSK